MEASCGWPARATDWARTERRKVDMPPFWPFVAGRSRLRWRMPVRIVRLGSPRLPDEGLRLGTVRRPPRGVPKADFAKRDYYDVWLPNLAPAADTVAQGLGASDDK